MRSTTFDRILFMHTNVFTSIPAYKVNRVRELFKDAKIYIQRIIGKIQ